MYFLNFRLVKHSMYGLFALVVTCTHVGTFGSRNGFCCYSVAETTLNSFSGALVIELTGKAHQTSVRRYEYCTFGAY